MKPVLIDNATDMADLLVSFESEPVLAVDTEFFRETSYYPQLGLVQIASDKIVACIDPLAFDASSALRAIFLNKNIVKVFHSCSQDLEVLFYTYGCLPVPLHDTQIAAALLGEQEQIGYANLVKAELDVQLAKSQTRTNWIKRPLTTLQMDYAGDDVFYLYKIHQQLIQQLKQAGRYEWFEEDCKKIDTNSSKTGAKQQLPFSVDMESLWRRVKGSNKLNGKTLAIVHVIASWREHIAMETDTTRRRVLTDEVILQLALNPPQQTADINWLSNNRFQLSTKRLQTLLQTIQSVQRTSAEQWPVNTVQPLSATQKKTLKLLQELLNEKASELGISTTVIASRKTLEGLINGNSNNNAILQGWRRNCLGERFLKQLPE